MIALADTMLQPTEDPDDSYRHMVSPEKQTRKTQKCQTLKNTEVLEKLCTITKVQS